MALWWEATEWLRRLLWPLAVAVTLVAVLPGCDRLDGVMFQKSIPFGAPEAHKAESEIVLPPIIVDDKSPATNPPAPDPGTLDIDAVTNWLHESTPDHMPSGTETEPPRGWVEFCAANQNDPGCIE